MVDSLLELPSGSFGGAPQLPCAILRCLHLLRPVSYEVGIGCLLKSIMSQHLCEQTVRGMWHTTENSLNLLEPTDTSDRYFLFRNWICYQMDQYPLSIPYGTGDSKMSIEVVRFCGNYPHPLHPLAEGGREQSQARKSQVSTKWIC